MCQEDNRSTGGRVGEITRVCNEEGNIRKGQKTAHERHEEARAAKAKERHDARVHSRAQVRDERNERDLATARNYRTQTEHPRKRINYRCSRCRKQVGCEDYTHAQHLVDCYGNETPGIDYVECQFCEIVGVRIASHIKTDHPEISKDDYIKLHGPVMAYACRQKYVNAGKSNGDWINRVKEAGGDLTEYKKRMGRAVSNAILSNPEKCARRSELSKTTITQWAQSEEGRLSSSETAKETSSKPEILEARAQNLRAWRAREPEAFQEIIRKLTSFQSKPEKWTREFLQANFPEYDFRGNQMLISHEHFSEMKTNRRQIDILSRDKKIIVEVDGPFHFKEINGWVALDEAKRKDDALNMGAIAMGYAVIRIAMDQWHASGELKEDCQLWLLDKVRNAAPGLYRRGKWYYDEPEIEEETVG